MSNTKHEKQIKKAMKKYAIKLNKKRDIYYSKTGNRTEVFEITLSGVKSKLKKIKNLSGSDLHYAVTILNTLLQETSNKPLKYKKRFLFPVSVKGITYPKIGWDEFLKQKSPEECIVNSII